MQIKKYIAPNVQEALRQVKQELGPEALILSVKNIKATSGPLALLSPSRVEVTAASDEMSYSSKIASEQSNTKPKLTNTYTRTKVAQDQDKEKINSHPERANPYAHTYQINTSSPQGESSLTHRYLQDFQKVGLGAKQVAQNMIRTLSGFHEKGNKSLPENHSHKAHKTNQPKNERIASLGKLLRSIGLQEDILEHIVEVLCQEIPHPETSYDTFRLEGLAKEILEPLVKTSGPINLEGPKPRFLVMVGPTGTGKTTTIAKLSAEMLLKKKKKVGLITIDTYRVGAMEQLNTYAGIMNIPVKLASTFEQMRKVIMQYQDQDVVFIDTAGFSHHDREHLQLLNAFLAQVPNPQVHLVVSVNTNEKELINISQKFNLLHYNHLLFTKLDESSYLGAIFNHMVYTGKSISYLTTGQTVPDDIELATPTNIIQMMFQKRQFYDAAILKTK